MAIHLVDSGGTISLEFTVDYNAGRGTLSAGKIFINKDDFEVSYEDTFVVITNKDKDDVYKIVYSDITTPSGASASAVAALIEAFQDTAGGGGATAANQATQITAEQAIQASVQIIDDWDESDRAKTNPIVGQAGIDGGEGSPTAKTVRVILANTNQPTVGTSGTISTVTTLTSGNVGGFTTLVQSTVVMSVAGAYATGDYMGTTTTPQSFASAVRVSGGTGVIKSILISDKITTSNVAMELWIIDRTFTAPTDNAAWNLSDTDMLFVQAVIPISNSLWYASSAGQVYFDGLLSIPIKSNGTTLFYALVARGTTPSFTSSDLTITLGILQD